MMVYLTVLFSVVILFCLTLAIIQNINKNIINFSHDKQTHDKKLIKCCINCKLDKDDLIQKIDNNTPYKFISEKDIFILKNAGLFNNKPILKFEGLEKEDISVLKEIYEIRKVKFIILAKNFGEEIHFKKLLYSTNIDFSILNLETISFSILTALNKINLNYDYINKETDNNYLDIVEYISKSKLFLGCLKSVYTTPQLSFYITEFFFEGKGVYINIEKLKKTHKFIYKIPIYYDGYPIIKINKHNNFFYIKNISNNDYFYIHTKANIKIFYNHINRFIGIIFIAKSNSEFLFVITKNNYINLDEKISMILVKSYLNYNQKFEYELFINNNYINSFLRSCKRKGLLYFINYHFLYDNKNDLNKFSSKINPFLFYKKFLSEYLGFIESEDKFYFSKGINKINCTIQLNNYDNFKINFIYDNFSKDKLVVNGVEYQNCKQVLKKELNKNIKDIKLYF